MVYYYVVCTTQYYLVFPNRLQPQNNIFHHWHRHQQPSPLLRFLLGLVQELAKFSVDNLLGM